MMTFITQKWLIAVLVIVGILVLLWFIGDKSVKASVSIQTSKEKVWQVLTDLEAIKDWNKVLIPTNGLLQTGQTISYNFYQEEGGKAASMDAKVKQIIPGELINQTGGIPGVLTFNHRYVLTIKGNETIVTIEEQYRGVMVPFWNPEPVEKAYERLLESLKGRVIDLHSK